LAAGRLPKPEAALPPLDDVPPEELLEWVQPARTVTAASVAAAAL